jgi:hypothetical protein
MGLKLFPRFMFRLYDKAGDKVGRKARKECDPSKVTSMEALRSAITLHAAKGFHQLPLFVSI